MNRVKSQRAKLHSTEGVNYDISDGWKFMETIARYFYVAIFFSLFLSLFFFLLLIYPSQRKWYRRIENFSKRFSNRIGDRVVNGRNTCTSR